jgi:hypothetical protein
MLFYAVGVVLFGAALAHALVLDHRPGRSIERALLRGKGPAKPYAAANLRPTLA